MGCNPIPITITITVIVVTCVARPHGSQAFILTSLPSAGRWQPEESAGWLSHMLYTYCNGLLALGARKVLMQDDLWAVSRHASLLPSHVVPAALLK